jgi:putative hydrolase of the HAD superfamily
VTVEAVFFDAGETLVHPHPSFAELFALVLRREGHEVADELVVDRVLLIGERFQRAARDRELWTTTPARSKAFWMSVYEAFLTQLGLPANDALLELLHREFTDLANYALFDDVVPTLDSLRANGVTLGVISNFEEWLERLLEELGVASYFDVRVISGIEGLEKPDLGIFRIAIDRAGVPARNAAYVGDNPVLDLEPAAAVGMTPVLVDRRGRHAGYPGARITSMSELPDALGLVAEEPERATPAAGEFP